MTALQLAENSTASRKWLTGGAITGPGAPQLGGFIDEGLGDSAARELFRRVILEQEVLLTACVWWLCAAENGKSLYIPPTLAKNS